jgi:O-succinylbenzoic acid--CoA ligase
LSTPDWLSAAAARAPARTALQTPAGSLDHSQLDERAAAAAGALVAAGAGPGDRVAIALAPGADFAAVLHGCLRLGAAAMPIDPRLTPGERDAMTATATVVVDGPLDGGHSAAPEPRPHEDADIAVVVHTSGSTGAPRPVELSFGNLEASARASAKRLGAADADRWLCPLPLSHVGGLSILVRSAIAGTTAVVHEGFDTDAVAAALAGDEITIVSLVPTMVGRLLDAGVRPGPALRCVLIGGGPLGAELAARAAEAGLPVAQTYGLTEASSQVTTSEIGDATTAGRPLDGVEVELAADGEILVSGPTVAAGSVAADGRLHTGDLGRFDEEGRLIVTGRGADTIVSGGENVAPAEVEAVLEAHPEVAEAAVFGIPDPEWGEAVVARIVPRPGTDPDTEELRRHCRAVLASFKVPKTFERAESLPRTASGKLRRGDLI